MTRERKERENYHHNRNEILRQPRTGERRQGTRTHIGEMSQSSDVERGNPNDVERGNPNDFERVNPNDVERGNPSNVEQGMSFES